MRIASWMYKNAIEFGLVLDDKYISINHDKTLLGATGVAQALGRVPISKWLDTANTSTRQRSLNEVELLPPVTDAERILCVGLNYHKHAIEVGLPVPQKPSLFVRFKSSFVGHGAPIIAPKISSQFDFEGELAVIIGKPGYQILRGDVATHILGYTILADNSIRDWQKHTSQATAGKNFPSTGSIGPWCTTSDMVDNPESLKIVTRLNGQIVQNGNTNDMIFSIPKVISYVSQFTPLSIGDVISLGTPQGVGMGRTPPLWMKPNDHLEIEVEKLGTLSNRIIAE